MKKSNSISLMLKLTFVLMAISILALFLFLLLVKSPLQVDVDVTVRAPSTTRYYSLEVELPLSYRSRLHGMTNCLLILPRKGGPEWRLNARVDLFLPLPHVLRLRLIPRQNDDETRLYLADLAEGTLRTRLITGEESLWIKLLRGNTSHSNL